TAYVAAVITTSARRAADLRHPPVLVSGAVNGGPPIYAAPPQGPAGAGPSPRPAPRAGGGDAVGRGGPDDVDVALLADDFSPMVLMQLEDYGFCGRGEAPALVAEGRIPVNTHGGNITEAFLRGETHVVEAVKQLRGTASHQVPGASTALV